MLFKGIKIIDLTKVLSGPFASRYFSDYGADVIKIEFAENGDESRSFGPIKNSVSGYFETLNRGKKSFFLNLTKSDDLDIFYTLIKDADIVLENFSPHVSKKLIIEGIEDIFMNFNSADLKKKLDLLQIPNGIIHKMTDIIDNQEYINSNYIKKVDHPQLGNITVPFEFIKYDQFPLENYIISPEKNTY